jgi:hypothetical protein
MPRYSDPQRFFIACWYESFGSPIVVQRKFRSKFGHNAQLVTNFYLWGDLKRRVYSQGNPGSIDELKIRIRDAIEEITPETRLAALASFHTRLNLCIEQDGGHVENRL